MSLDEQTITRLLGGIQANNLVLLCGAGLSIPSPSNLMSAVAVARACYDAYQVTGPLPAEMRDAIDRIAGHFHASHEFESVFIKGLVPWRELTGRPNEGHAAVSDLLICRAIEAALSANFDLMIEQWAMNRKIDMRGALDGLEAIAFQHETNPLLKFHGCMTRERGRTLWTQAQLAEPMTAQRVEACADWMRMLLPGKDLLVVGFWTDWGYLNQVLEGALNTLAFNSVTVIDPSPAADLQAKAPALWAALNPGNIPFQHFRESGADALAQLRVAFSKVWLRRFFSLAAPLLAAEGKACPAFDSGLNCDDLYNSRRDAEGLPYNRAARTREPAAATAQAAFAHHLLLQAGATREGPWYLKDGSLVRVVLGAGRAMNTVREEFKEPPASRQPGIVVCAGAMDLEVPGNIMNPGNNQSVVRPSGGGTARWLTLDQARGELAI